jgi:hypothetical protein
MSGHLKLNNLCVLTQIANSVKPLHEFAWTFERQKPDVPFCSKVGFGITTRLPLRATLRALAEPWQIILGMGQHWVAPKWPSNRWIFGVWQTWNPTELVGSSWYVLTVCSCLTFPITVDSVVIEAPKIMSNPEFLLVEHFNSCQIQISWSIYRWFTYQNWINKR